MINSLITIAVISYNQENTICECLDSLLSQKCNFDFNIIISDDSSTDKTANICRTYFEKYPGIITLNINSINLGLMRNYTSTLSQCQSKYIAFCAGDDFWCDNLLLKANCPICQTTDKWGSSLFRKKQIRLRR